MFVFEYHYLYMNCTPSICEARPNWVDPRSDRFVAEGYVRVAGVHTYDQN